MRTKPRRPSTRARSHPPVRSPVASGRCAVAPSVAATTTVPPATESLASFIAGFVAAEGTFVQTGPRPRFQFAVEQYLAWRDRLLEHWEHDAKRVRPCAAAGCDEPRRAHGLCRHHLATSCGG